MHIVDNFLYLDDLNLNNIRTPTLKQLLLSQPDPNNIILAVPEGVADGDVYLRALKLFIEVSSADLNNVVPLQPLDWQYIIMFCQQFDNMSIIVDIEIALGYRKVPKPEETRELWGRAATYQDLLDLNKNFVEGKTNETPYRAQPFEHDSIPLINDLVEMNRLQLFTVDSQAGTCSNDYIGEPDRYLVEERRGYVHFFVPYSPEALRLAHMLLQDPELVGIVYNFPDKTVLDNLEDQGAERKDDDFMFNVTRSRESGQDKWDNYANMHIGDHRPEIQEIVEEWAVLPNIPEILKNTLYIEVAMKQYCVPDLEKKILRYWKSILNIRDEAAAV